MADMCFCNAGYDGPPGGPCEDVNECQSNNGHGPCDDICRNTVGSYVCDCSTPGYIIDGHICICKYIILACTY